MKKAKKPTNFWQINVHNFRNSYTSNLIYFLQQVNNGLRNKPATSRKYRPFKYRFEHKTI